MEVIMKIVILEIGQFFDMPSMRQAFSSVEIAETYIPEGFMAVESTMHWKAYENEKTEQYANINILEVETKSFNKEIQQVEGHCPFLKCQHAYLCNKQCDFIKHGC
jgi:hypothetical protein